MEKIFDSTEIITRTRAILSEWSLPDHYTLQIFPVPDVQLNEALHPLAPDSVVLLLQSRKKVGTFRNLLETHTFKLRSNSRFYKNRYPATIPTLIWQMDRSYSSKYYATPLRE